MSEQTGQMSFLAVRSLIARLWGDIRGLDSRNRLHFVATLTLLVAGLPLTRAARLEVAGPSALLKLIPAIAAQGISLGALLFLIQYPKKVVAKLKGGDRRRYFFIVPVLVLFFFLYSPTNAAFFSIGAVAIAEYVSFRPSHLSNRIVSFLLAASYFLFGFGLVYEFNDIIASFRFYGAYDPVFLRVDRWILLGGSVSGMERWVQGHVTSGVFLFLEAVYYGTFAQVGAGILLCALTSGISRSFRLVGTILLSYYVTLVCFFLLPSHGPYLLCADHFRTFPKMLNSYVVQKIFLTNVKLLWHHTGTLVSTGGYYISFPCMHITQPLIVMWFLRRFKRMIAALVIYDLVLIPAILILEWHYAVDILGGVVVAAIAIYLVGDHGNGKLKEVEP